MTLVKIYFEMYLLFLSKLKKIEECCNLLVLIFKFFIILVSCFSCL